MNTQRNLKTNTPALSGAILSTSGQSLPDLWRILHSNANLCARFVKNGQASRKASISELIGDAEATIRKELQSVAASSWERLCEAAGWTQIGAATLSWCSDATAEQVWRAWEETTMPMPADDVFFIAAKSMNETFLFDGSTLSSFLPLFFTERIRAYVSLAARSEQILMDCTSNDLHAMPRDFLDFLSHSDVRLAYPDTKR